MQSMPRYSYKDCMNRAKRANWDLDQFRNIRLDFSNSFLPENLARTNHLPGLDQEARLRLNQIRGYAYAHLFRFVEEYIIKLVNELMDSKEDEARHAALRMFLDEEIKHQELFLCFERAFENDFPISCTVVDNMGAVAETILSHSRLSVILLTCMLEWLTQAHYLAYFEDENSTSLDDAFKDLFRLHWVEEAQHARLDSLEVLREAEGKDQETRDTAIREFLSLCSALVEVLHRQADFDIESLKCILSVELGERDLEEIARVQKAAYVHTFVTLGLKSRHFRKLVSTISANGLSIIDSYRATDAICAP